MATITDRLETRMEMTGLAGTIRGLMAYGAAMKEANSFVGPQTTKELAKIDTRLAGMRQNLILVGEAAAIAFGAAAIGGLIHAQIEVEKLNRQLEGLFGQAGAEQTNSFMTRFATETSSNLGDVREALLAIASEGVQPTNRLMRDLVKLSNMSGRSLKDVAVPAAKALRGDMEALKEFGINPRDIRRFGFGPEGVQRAIEHRTEGSPGTVNGAAGAFNDTANAWRNLQEAFTSSNTVVILLEFATTLITAADKMNQALVVFKSGLQLAIQEMMKYLDPRFYMHGFKDPLTDKLKKDFSKNVDDYLSIGAKEPGKLTNPTLGQRPIMSEVIQQILGSQIGRLGIKASELPGIRPTARAPIVVRLENEDTSLESMINRALNKLNMHGALHPN